MASQIPYLDVQNLTKRFGAQVLFDNISFSIAEGQKGVDRMAGNTTNISIRMDADLKAQADALFTELGMNPNQTAASRDFFCLASASFFQKTLQPVSPSAAEPF